MKGVIQDGTLNNINQWKVTFLSLVGLGFFFFFFLRSFIFKVPPTYARPQPLWV